MNVSSRNPVQFFHQPGLPVIQMTGRLWLKHGRRPLTPYRLIQSRNLGFIIAVQRMSLVWGPSFSHRLALCEGSELGTMTLILESDRTLVFTVLLLLLVEGFEIFAALSFDIVVEFDFVVVVVTRCRAARSVIIGIVLWLTVVGLSTRDIILFFLVAVRWLCVCGETAASIVCPIV